MRAAARSLLRHTQPAAAMRNYRNNPSVYDPQVLTPEHGNGLSRLMLEIPQSPCSRRNTHHFAAVAELLLIFIEKAEHNASEETQLPQCSRRWL
ncbi:hypothetical protein MG293_011376 [Ovis ammon polii]|uniref:Uncharacterized protein n=1 Tax=Ovis ammon polii TaxID=230172 RepID=A0AAD4Y839_OVIAM|nr:hypothetical protein MG293_011376 [Ovis ammon polii]KAI4562182.1 hypothetical protein MJT46_011144 [Ovis ammon polii x Ovis aries]